MTALLLYDEHAGDIAREAETVLSDDGLFITTRSTADATVDDVTEAEALVVVRTADATTSLMLWAGYAWALKTPVLLIDDTSEVPDPLRRWPRIDPTTKLWKPELCDRLRSLLGWNRPSAAGLHGDDLARWVAEDLDRLDRLSATEYEELFATLFARFDCSVERNDAGLVLQDDRNGRRLFAHFKFAPTSDTIGITTIRDCVAAVARYECDFGVVVSNREFSPAARGFADEQSPAVWLASRDWFASVVTAKFSGNRSDDLARLADDLRSQKVLTLFSSSSRTRILPSLPRPSYAKGVPVQLVIVHYDEEEARDLEDYCSSFAALAYEYPFQCSRVDVRKNLRLRMREVFTARAEHHVIFLDNGGSFGRQLRSHCYTALTSVARDLELRGRIGVIDDSPDWSQLCAPRSLDAVFVPRTRSAIEKWLKEVLGVAVWAGNHHVAAVDDGESARRILATTGHFTGDPLDRERRDQPTMSRDGEALRWFALAQAPEPFRLIRREGAWFSMKSRNARRTDGNLIRLGQGRASAYLAFQKNPDLVQEAEEWIDAVVSREGAERVVQMLREYSGSLSKQMARAAEPRVKDQVEREIQAIESYVRSVESGR
jgi:hypothetical protein